MVEPFRVVAIADEGVSAFRRIAAVEDGSAGLQFGAHHGVPLRGRVPAALLVAQRGVHVEVVQNPLGIGVRPRKRGGVVHLGRHAAGIHQLRHSLFLLRRGRRAVAVVREHEVVVEGVRAQVFVDFNAQVLCRVAHRSFGGGGLAVVVEDLRQGRGHAARGGGSVGRRVHGAEFIVGVVLSPGRLDERGHLRRCFPFGLRGHGFGQDALAGGQFHLLARRLEPPGRARRQVGRVEASVVHVGQHGFQAVVARDDHEAVALVDVEHVERPYALCGGGARGRCAAVGQGHGRQHGPARLVAG